MKEMLYAVRCLKSNEAMILALAEQFKQLSHEPEKFRWLNGIRTHDLWEPVQCSNQLSYEVTQLRGDQFVGLMFSRERNVVWMKCYLKCGVWNQMKIWSWLEHCTGSQRSWVRIPLSHLNFSGSWDNCLNCPASAKIISSFNVFHVR